MNANELIILLLFLSTSIFAQETPLHRIVENGKIGFINNKGETVIQANYLEAGEFSEGLASFRIGGQYGFINSNGEVVIPAKYDFVGDFQNGIVDVYVDGEVTFINKEENRVLPKSFESIRCVDKNLCVFTTKKDKSGLYDLSTSSIVMKAKKIKIGEFSDGLAVVTRGDNYLPDCGVIDKMGRFIVDFGVYKKIEKFVDGYALVERNNLNDEEEIMDGLIDTKGKLYELKDRKGNSTIAPVLNEIDSFKNGLHRAIVDKKLTYLNEAGEIVWQEKIGSNIKTDNTVNITHLRRGHFYAYSKAKETGSRYNGWSVSTNVPKGLSKKRSKKKLVLEEKNDKLYIKNHSKKAIQFEAQDSRLYLKLQAKDKNGEWKDIEYLPSS